MGETVCILKSDYNNKKDFDKAKKYAEGIIKREPGFFKSVKIEEDKICGDKKDIDAIIENWIIENI